MRPFDHHIHALLLDHDCVIVPELGGFIASRQRARIDSKRLVGIPPKRSIAFNVYLRQNDGLLAKRLVDTEKISYPEALQSIEAYVSDCMQQMGRGGSVRIRNVGALAYDVAKNIQFEPETDSQLCPDAFGLAPIPVHILDSTVKSAAQPLPSIRKPKKQDANRRQRSVVSILTVAGAIMWFSLNLYLVSRDRYGKAGMNPLDSVFPEESVSPVISPPPAPVVKVETVFVPAVQPEPLIVDSNSHPAPEVESVKQETPQKETPVSIAPEQGRYYIVTGVFKIRDNADGLVRELKAAGFDSASIIDTNKEFYYVSVASFNHRADAMAFHRDLRGKDVSGWIYRR